MAILVKDDSDVQPRLCETRDWGTVVVESECEDCGVKTEARWPVGELVLALEGGTCPRCGGAWATMPVRNVEDGTMSVPGGTEVAG